MIINKCKEKDEDIKEADKEIVKQIDELKYLA